MIAARQTMWRSVKKGLGVWRYLKIVILTKYDKASTNHYIQMSEWQFIDADGNRFVPPATPTVDSLDSFDPILQNRDLTSFADHVKNLFDGSTSTKMCVFGMKDGSTTEPCPCWFVVDFGSECLDLTTYNRYRWYTANDTSSCQNRNPTGWALYVSNDNEKWTLVDRVENQNTPLTNYTLAYTSDAMKTLRKAQIGYNLSVTVNVLDWDSSRYYWLSGSTASGSPFSLTYNMGGERNVWLLNYETSVDISKPVVIEHAISNIVDGGFLTEVRYDSGRHVNESVLNFDVHVTMYC